MAAITLPKALPAKAVCRRLKISQQQIAFVADRSTSQVSNVLNGWLKDDAVEDALRTLLGDDFTEAEIFDGES